jgi:hypothetical protein
VFVVPEDALLPPISHTSEGLRDALFDEINGLRAGMTTIQKAKTVAMLAARIIESVRAQIQIQRLVEGNAKNVGLGTSPTVGKAPGA